MDFCGDCQYMDKYNKEYGKDNYMCTMHREYRCERDVACNNYKPNCFITTIVTVMLGFPDNGVCLSALRDVREKYLKKTEAGILLLQEYDQIGPKISRLIFNSPKLYARFLYEEYIKKCYEQITNNNITEGVRIYIEMVEHLKRRYSYELYGYKTNYELPYDLETLGKGRIRHSKTATI